MKKHLNRWLLGAVVLAALCIPGFAQQSFEHRAATLSGSPGLFMTWDAEALKPGEVYFSTGAFKNHRDPGQLTITTLPAALGIGVLPKIEIFGSLETQKRIEADDISVYRVQPTEIPQPSLSPAGERLFSSSAPFIDVPIATGRGDMFGNIKFNFLSQRDGHPVAFSAVAVGSLPGHKTAVGLNRGLSTGDIEVGFGGLLSKKWTNGTQFHLNGLWSFHGDPRINGEGVSDLHHKFILRTGTAVPLKEHLQATGEVQYYYYFGHLVPGLDPKNPVDIIAGLRVYPSPFVYVGGGYVASVNHIEEDPARSLRAASTHGFMFQLGFAFRRQD